jgi:hypothetical protein
MRPFRRLASTVIAAALLFGGVPSSTVAQAAETSSVPAVSEPQKIPAASKLLEHWYYLGRYYNLRHCQEDANTSTPPYGPYDDAQCRDAGDYWELWGVIY